MCAILRMHIGARSTIIILFVRDMTGAAEQCSSPDYVYCFSPSLLQPKVAVREGPGVAVQAGPDRPGHPGLHVLNGHRSHR